jgi:hypothetical protein
MRGDSKKEICCINKISLFISLLKAKIVIKPDTISISSLEERVFSEEEFIGQVLRNYVV